MLTSSQKIKIKLSIRRQYNGRMALSSHNVLGKKCRWQIYIFLSTPVQLLRKIGSR